MSDAINLVILGMGMLARFHQKAIKANSDLGVRLAAVRHRLELMAATEIGAGKQISRVGDLGHAVELLEMVKAQRIGGQAVVYPHRRSDENPSMPSWSPQDEHAYLQAGGSGPWH